MSENSIDVDVNFHLNDIIKLFEEAMKGDNSNIIDVIKDISVEEDKLKGSSLLHDVTLTEEKTKLLEAMSNMGVVSDVVNDVFKLVNDMNLKDGDNSDVIQRTQRSMVTLLTLSKTMLKMFDEKFPISEDMADELEEMDKVLQNSQLSMDSKIDQLYRIMNNAFAPLKEQQQDMPDAFKTTHPTTGGYNFSLAQVDVIDDYAEQVTVFINSILSRISGNTSNRLRIGKDDVSQMDNLTEIKDDIFDIIDKLKARTGGSEGVGRVAEAVEGYMGSTSAYAKKVFENIEKVSVGMVEALEEMQVMFDYSSTKMDAATTNLDGSIVDTAKQLGEAVDTLKSSEKHLLEMTKDVKSAVRTEVGKIKDVLDNDFYTKTVENILDTLITLEFIDPIAVTVTLKKLQHTLKVSESTLKTLHSTMGVIGKGQTNANLLEFKAAIDSIQAVVDISKNQLKGIGDDEGFVSDTLNVKKGVKGFQKKKILNTDLLEQMSGRIDKLAISTMAKDIMVASIEKKFDELIGKANQILTETGEIRIGSEHFNTNVSVIANAMQQAQNQLTATKNLNMKTVVELNKIIEDWNTKLGSITGTVLKTIDISEYSGLHKIV